MSGLVPGPDRWWLAPEGAVVHREEGVAVIADVHLGYEWSRGRGGDQVPAHSLRETIARLATLLDRAAIGRLIVAGDLVESARPCRRTSIDLLALDDWLASRGVRRELVLGNHDSARSPKPPMTIEVDGWTIGHGHVPIAGSKTIRGHDHPMLKVGRTSARCLLVGPSSIVLPAFSDNAAGLNVAQSPVPRPWRDEPFVCWAGAGAILRDFGPIRDLAERLGRG